MTRDEARELISKHSYKCENGNYVISKRVAFIIADCLENESLQNRACENCKRYSTGKQPDGFKWHKCDYAFECKTCFNDYFERAEQ